MLFPFPLLLTILVTNASGTQIVVQSVAERTPAAAAGLKRGDEILTLDGGRASALTLEGVRARFRKPATHRLEIVRGGEHLRVKLTTRRLV